MTRDDIQAMKDEIENKINELSPTYKAAKSARPTRAAMQAFDTLALEVLELFKAREELRWVELCVLDAEIADRRARQYQDNVRTHMRNAEIAKAKRCKND